MGNHSLGGSQRIRTSPRPQIVFTAFLLSIFSEPERCEEGLESEKRENLQEGVLTARSTPIPTIRVATLKNQRNSTASKGAGDFHAIFAIFAIFATKITKLKDKYEKLRDFRVFWRNLIRFIVFIAFR